VLALGAALFAIALAAVARDVSHWGTPDLVIYRRAGLTASHSGQLYTRSFGPGRFNYPPFSALIFEALATPLATARWMMTGTSMVALVVSAWVTAGAAGIRASAIRAGAALAIAWAAVWADPVMSTLTWGQVDLLVLAVALADLCMREDRWWKGAGVGLAAGIKLTPVIFIGYLLVTRRYRQALVAITAFALTIMASFAVLPDQARQFWLGGLFLHQQRVGDPSALPDQSLDGMIARLAGPGHGSGWYAWLAAAAIVGAGGLLLAALAHKRGLGLLGIVTCAVTGLLVSPISWDHHWVWIVPLPVAALAVIRERGVTLGTACLVALAALFLDYPIFSGADVSVRSPLDGLIWSTGGNPYNWHGLQLITGNLYVLGGLAILCAVALVIAESNESR
jgi:alpha-1,2-mannosyltransferase